jgi:Co/Zn/Cd efflux system component
MKTTTFRIAKMDCSAEEQLVRMALDPIEGVAVRRIDLDERTVTVNHRGDTVAIKTTLDRLNLETTQLTTTTAQDVPASSQPDGERGALTAALLINAGLFVAEFAAGLIGRSMGLVADSLDMLADATVYALSLLAVGAALHRKKSLARTSGYLQLGLAIAGVVETVRRLLTSEALPDVPTMIVVSSIALTGNVVTLLILKRIRSEEVHFQASWIFTSNDIKVNTLVIAAAIIVAVTDHAAADLLAGAAIFIIVANGARRILALSR